MVVWVLRGWALCLAVLLSSCSVQPERSAFELAWQRYLALFYEDGRIVDTGNQDVSHSEGQGYALLFAVAADDQQTFSQLWQWTQSTLQRDDNLFHWQYTPCETRDRLCVSDPNNASDGDMLIAWALLKAAGRWDVPAYRQAAKAIIQALESHVIVKHQQAALLLPAAAGFVQGDANLQLNLSYWIFPALRAFEQAGSATLWQNVYNTGLTLLREARFSDYDLPPDWVRWQENSLTLTNTLSQEYGFNACRIPLHLVWAGETDRDLLRPFLRWWQQPQVPATYNLATGAPADYSYTVGMQAIEHAVSAILQEQPADFVPLNRKLDYYSASLVLFSMLAVSESSQ
ncbi:glycosyl hydrolase family 8 [Alteromonas sp. CYL-A6]|uniref:glycosyl hydrolase family 8 n=1 Tax=Alteromonas nitratireducens TaxID=3390813 RepID=UPI0034AFB44E